MVSRLSDRVTATLFDLPGHGQSGPLAQGISMQEVVAEVIRSLATEAGQPVDILGHSFGATAALRAVAETPDIARSLTLIDPVWFEAARGTPEFDEHVTRMAAFADAGGAGDMTRAAHEFMAVWSEVPFDRLPTSERERMLTRIPLVVRSEADLFADPLGLFAPGGLDAVRCPVAIVEGGRSPAIVGAIADRLIAGLPQAQRTTVAGAGHMVAITHPGEVAMAVRDLMDA